MQSVSLVALSISCDQVVPRANDFMQERKGRELEQGLGSSIHLFVSLRSSNHYRMACSVQFELNQFKLNPSKPEESEFVRENMFLVVNLVEFSAVMGSICEDIYPLIY